MTNGGAAGVMRPRKDLSSVICYLSYPSFRRGCLVASVTEILLDLIGIPSVSSASNQGVIEYARRRLQPSQWDVRTFPYTDPNGIGKTNLIAVPKKGSNPEIVELALVCHTDTVPYPDDWSEAVHPKVIDERVYGRGACDVKGFLACILAAVADLDVAGRSVAVVLTAGEENGGGGGERVVGGKEPFAPFA